MMYPMENNAIYPLGCYVENKQCFLIPGMVSETDPLTHGNMSKMKMIFGMGNAVSNR